MSNINVNDIIKKLKEGKLDDPNSLSGDLIILSASLMTAYNFDTDAEIAYAKKWTDLKLEFADFSDKRIDMLVKGSEEYKILRQAKASIKTMEEVIRALKKRLQNMDTERREIQNYG